MYSEIMEAMGRPQTRMKVFRNSKCHCGKKYDGTEYFVLGYDQKSLRQCCRMCFEIDAAELEADDNRWRWTAIACGIEGYDCYYGSRCACGCTKPASLDFCVKCWREYRMIGKNEADVKFNRRLINQLKELMKNGKKHQDNG